MLKDDLVQLTTNLSISKCKYDDLIAKIGSESISENNVFQIAKKTCKPNKITEPASIETDNAFKLLDSDFPAISQGGIKNKIVNTQSRPSKPRVIKSVGDNRPIISKVLLVSDSQGRGCNKMLQSKLGDSSKVQSILKPNAPLKEVLKDIAVHTKDFGENDVVIVMGGTNNIEANTTYDVLRRDVDKALVQLLPLSNKTNVIINPIPMRYDTGTSGLNEIINQANQHLHSQVNSIHNINKKRIAINFEVERLTREQFTRQGLHLNQSGKNHICNRSAALIKMFRPNSCSTGMPTVARQKSIKQMCLDEWLIKKPNISANRPNHFLDKTEILQTIQVK